MVRIRSTHFSKTFSLGSALFALACGNSTSTGTATDAGPDTSTTPDGGSVDSSADSAPGPKTQMLLSSGQFGSGMGNTNLLFKNFTAVAGERCAITKQGACYVSDCRPGDGGARPHGVSAGTITISSATGPLLEIKPAPSDGTYGGNSVTTMPMPWAPGDALTFAATGADIPAFSVPQMVAPGVPVLLSPLPPDGGAGWFLPRSSDLTVTWQPVAGTVSVAFDEPTSGVMPNDLRIVCEYDGMGGTATVPASVMQLFDAGTTTTFNVARAVTADVTPGGYPIHVFLWSALTYPVLFQ